MILPGDILWSFVGVNDVTSFIVDCNSYSEAQFFTSFLFELLLILLLEKYGYT